ncbi:MAG TPA: hypothetical protein PK569_20390 [Thermoanaerobaculia bacterium]|jgi:hypothetical protein|nr:hypothetical protein [Thermoanaerobaculia bacterium]HQN09933.1 hypothetical protein [Thermoanaerobaculia bacterium]
MSIREKVLGPTSKYDRRLPYTYEARIAVAGVPGMTESWIDDTLCGLLEKLAAEKTEPADVTILEVRPEGEVPVDVAHCLGADGTWLRRPEACRVFEEHYAGHERTGRCCYRDRSREADGPFVEYDPPTEGTKASG